MNESYCIKDKRVTPWLNQVVIKPIKMVEDSFIVIVLFVE